MNYHINIFYSEEDGGYIADVPDLEFCSAFGSTPAEALAELEKAKSAWLEQQRQKESRQNQSIALPSTKLPLDAWVEEGFLVWDMGIETAIELGREFGQHAVLGGK
jgi:predicted RNase H-like HicB family nuclease